MAQMVIFKTLGTPPEDDAGAVEGAPAAASDPAKSERVNSLAARVDAFMADDEDDAGKPKARQSEPSFEVAIDDGEPHRIESAPSILIAARDASGPTEGNVGKPLVRMQSEPSEAIELDEVEEVHESKPVISIPSPPLRPPPRPGMPPPPPPRISIPPPRIPQGGRPPAIPPVKTTQTGMGVVAIPQVVQVPPVGRPPGDSPPTPDRKSVV